MAGVWKCFFLIFPQTVSMKCQSLFSGKNKKYIMNLSSAEFGQAVVKNNMQLRGIRGGNSFKIVFVPF